MAEILLEMGCLIYLREFKKMANFFLKMGNEKIKIKKFKCGNLQNKIKRNF